ncbi:tRNA (adenosine(37)-N6)-threonylcarbamoyltransferase complex dimerization subunit type 1 TsaB [bacterium]|nr:tRNA (adenosine(37)-N6)-threonylcarbamoyltransferase complex dimerization subunit type 1 TsaB [bacterium]
MALILSLETSTKVCSVALAKDSEVIAVRELYEANSHASYLTVFVQELFEELSDYSLQDIDAVAVSSGPGSYTGLRIGVSVAKGLCYALGKPLISITSLLAASTHVPTLPQLKGKVDAKTWYCPMIDARRMEVYCTLFNDLMEMQIPIEAKIIDKDSFVEELNTRKIVFYGDGSQKCTTAIQHPNAIFLDEVVPLASQMAVVAAKKYQAGEFEDVAYFEPFYLKDFIATTPKKKFF